MWGKGYMSEEEEEEEAEERERGGAQGGGRRGLESPASSKEGERRKCTRHNGEERGHRAT